MSGQNIKVTIESEESYWSELIIGLDTLLTVQHKVRIPSNIISAVSHFKVKLDKALVSSGSSEAINQGSTVTTKEDMTQAYHDSFTA